MLNAQNGSAQPGKVFAGKDCHRLEHSNFPKELGGVFHSVFQILEDDLPLPGLLFSPLFGSGIGGFGLKSVHFPLAFEFCVRLPLADLA